MPDRKSKAVIGEDGELLEADQNVDMDIYTEYAEAAYPNPGLLLRFWRYISDNIFIWIVIFVIVAVLVATTQSKKASLGPIITPTSVHSDLLKTSSFWYEETPQPASTAYEIETIRALAKSRP